ncbi:hypothetical protein JOL62DRAFT_248889 [Phyllosticta paracitricarpa]|uniref:Secreted protein n=1 Tax=Phyllosticta paracitricarpa TaxID=2016321 RepID=A0ABR1N1E2_9PEZI
MSMRRQPTCTLLHHLMALGFSSFWTVKAVEGLETRPPCYPGHGQSCPSLIPRHNAPSKSPIGTGKFLRVARV